MHSSYVVSCDRRLCVTGDGGRETGRGMTGENGGGWSRGVEREHTSIAWQAEHTQR